MRQFYHVLMLATLAVFVSCSDSQKDKVTDHTDNVLATNVSPASGEGTITFVVGSKLSEKVSGTSPELTRVTANGVAGSVNHRIVILFESASKKITSISHRWSTVSAGALDSNPDAIVSCEDEACALAYHAQGADEVDFNGVVLSGSTPVVATSTLIDHVHYQAK